MVAAGVTGSAIAIPLLGATGASAADATVDANTWDRLADCESGGVWSADTGNGYYGGLQLTQAVWEDHGGLKYAPTADLASRAQQIAVAEKVLAEQGPLAWPTCGLVAGFPLDVTNPTDEPEADPSQPADEATEEPADEPSSGGPSSEDPAPEAPGDTAVENPADVPADTPTDTPTDTPSGDTSGDSGDKARDDSADETGNSGQNGSGKHRGEPAPEAPGGDRDSNSSGRHASRGDGPRDDSRDDDGSTYTVRLGDSLSAIADARGIDGGWTALYEANEDAIGADPDLILPGQRLALDD
ncbi:transglycosylase family protein [Streptomyces luteolus]|uniref:Transglycosylase family protein n=1 Tax=Streptomyces luteolus TaxID=3043615 RepID=A0ABT6T3G9_9ACTN|nr:transglycosylase family protein [Streptomyces sp. B-S-A12]MDI3421960.1 transglycosylase family protein [Streptomyces sp. B-S-A12]